MTVPATTRRSPVYNGNGAATAFPFSFKVFAASDVQVLVTSVLGVLSTAVLNSDYSVALNADQTVAPGGTITYPLIGSPLAVGAKLVVIGAIPYDQPMSVPGGGGFNPVALENELDRQVIQIQQLAVATAGAIHVPTGETVPDLPAAAARANYLLGFNSSGDPVTVAPASGSAAALATDLAIATDGTKGTGLLGWLRNATGAVATTLYKLLGWQSPTVAEYMTAAQQADCAAGTLTLNVTAAVQAALDSLGAAGGEVIVPNGYRCLIDANLNVPANCALVGSKAVLGHHNGAFAGYAPALYVNSAATITLNNASQLRKLAVLRKGLTYNITSAQVTAQFLGSAITIADVVGDVVIDECLIAGFLYGIRTIAGATDISRVHLSKLNMDNVNCVYLQNAFDVNYLDHIHCWPFITVGSGVEANNAQLKRAGTGICLDGQNDWSKVTDSFTYGYNIGMRASGADSVTFTGCGSDHPSSAADGSFGFLVDGDSFEVRFVGCQTAAKEYGLYVNTVTATNGKVTATALNTWETKTAAVTNDHGTLILDSPVLRNTGGVGVGVQTVAASTETRVTGGSIKGFATGIANASATTRLFQDGIDFTGTTTPISAPFKPTVVAAEPLPVDGECVFYEVTGNTNFNTISNPQAYVNKLLVLKFLGTPTITDAAANVNLSANFTATANDILTLASDGTTFFEVARSAN